MFKRGAKAQRKAADGPAGQIPVGWHVDYAWPTRRRSTTSPTLHVDVRRKPFWISPRWLWRHAPCVAVIPTCRSCYLTPSGLALASIESDLPVGGVPPPRVALAEAPVGSVPINIFRLTPSGWPHRAAPKSRRLAAKRRIGVLGRGGSVRGGYSRRGDGLGLRLKPRLGELGRARKRGSRVYRRSGNPR